MTTALQHWHRRPGAKDWPGEMGENRVHDLLVLHLLNQRRLENCRIIDQHIDAWIARGDDIEGSPDGVGRGNVAGNGHSPFTNRFRDLPDLGQRTPEQGDILTIRREALRHGPAKPAVGARDCNCLTRNRCDLLSYFVL